MKELLKNAVGKGQKALSEYDSARVIASAGVAVTKYMLAKTRDQAVSFAREMGFPVVLKGCSDKVTHKTEMGMVKLKLKSDQEVAAAYDELTGKGVILDGVLVQEWIEGDKREFVIGLTRDPQFGPCVMFGLGGIFTEVLKDVSFRVAPLTELDAAEMIEEIRTRKMLDEFRGSPAVERAALVKALIGIGNLGLEYDEIREIDINPMVINGDKPVAVDALVILNSK
ncbi:MAG: carboxylate--amine ligase [Spirochaetes bacterium]|nr:MAG: carboxylate--amine ligase [Spirochaetota bacterium]